MPFQYSQQLIIFELSNVSIEHIFSQKTKMSQQLTNANPGRKVGNPRQLPQDLLLCCVDHGSTSPIFGPLAWSRRNLPITSTRMSAPGSNFATRDARVTP